jgi:hypothetical protein
MMHGVQTEVQLPTLLPPPLAGEGRVGASVSPTG